MKIKSLLLAAALSTIALPLSAQARTQQVHWNSHGHWPLGGVLNLLIQPHHHHHHHHSYHEQYNSGGYYNPHHHQRPHNDGGYYNRRGGGNYGGYAEPRSPGRGYEH